MVAADCCEDGGGGGGGGGGSGSSGGGGGVLSGGGGDAILRATSVMPLLAGSTAEPLWLMSHSAGGALGSERRHVLRSILRPTMCVAGGIAVQEHSRRSRVSRGGLHEQAPRSSVAAVLCVVPARRLTRRPARARVCGLRYMYELSVVGFCDHTTADAGVKFAFQRAITMALGTLVGIGVAAAMVTSRTTSVQRYFRSAQSSRIGGPMALLQSQPYEAPPWVPPGVTPPASRLTLAHLPTPLHRWSLPHAPAGTEVYIKRDDYTGSELSGNKVRKLEFLLAEALDKGCDSVITVGGIQSNHCRATAAAARRVGLEPHIILRGDPTTDPGLVGNLMVDRLVGAQIHLCAPGEFNAKGGATLVEELDARLAAAGRRPYSFPSGGSNPLGTWGYVQAIFELSEQLVASGVVLDRLYFACGSGGTAAGLALGVHWSGLGKAGTELVGLGVDDTPDDFYAKIDGIYRQMGLGPEMMASSRDLLRLEQCIGEGYAQATESELEFLVETARATGVVLDPVYSGKGALGMANDLGARPVDRACFLHTGGMLGIYEKADSLAPLLAGGWGAF